MLRIHVCHLQAYCMKASHIIFHLIYWQNAEDPAEASKAVGDSPATWKTIY